MIAQHEDTIVGLTRSLIPLYFLPFLNLDSSIKENEQLKLSSLNIFISLANSDKFEVVNFFANEELLSAIIKILEKGSEISIFVANCIIKIVLSKNEILDFICENENLLKKVKFFWNFFNIFKFQI